MTDQELFDKVAAHLLKQGVRAESQFAGGCAYRGENGTKCAAGVLIADEHYSDVLEGGKAIDAIVTLALKRSGVEESQLDLVHALQMIHDAVPPPGWKDELRNLAGLFRLSTAVLEQGGAA